MFHLEYFKNRDDGTGPRAVQLAHLFIKLMNRDIDSATDLIEKMIAKYQEYGQQEESYRYKVAIESHQPTALEFTKKQIEAQELRIQAKNFISNVRYHIENSGETQYRLPWLIIRCEMDKWLDSRSLSRLRSAISDTSEAEDWSDCRDWLTDNYSISYCEDCNEYEFDDEMHSAYNGYGNICRECIADSYRWSDYYDTYVHEDDARWARDADNSEVLIHEDDSNFRYDEDHDMWVHEDWEPPEPPIIGSYHSSKNHFRAQHDDWSAQFHRWFGVELEVETRDGDRNEKAKRLNEVINGGEIGSKVFFENDGSLNDGFEIITQPFSLPAQRELWQFLNDRNAVRGLRSHDTNTCGLHVHITKAELTQMQIAKMVTFVNDPANEPLIKAVARRYATGYCKIKKKSIDDAMDSTDRYEALNITPRRTI